MARAKVILVDADVISHFIAPYCDANDIEYIGVMDILLIAMNKGSWDANQCNQFMMDALRENNARFPKSRIEDYKTDKDLSEF